MSIRVIWLHPVYLLATRNKEVLSIGDVITIRLFSRLRRFIYGALYQAICLTAFYPVSVHKSNLDTCTFPIRSPPVGIYKIKASGNPLRGSGGWVTPKRCEESKALDGGTHLWRRTTNFAD